MGEFVELSVVIPVYNEIDNISPMLKAVEEALSEVDYELIFVDDGSSDGTPDAIRKLAHPRIVLVEFARNFGQTSAMAAGIAEARGELIATLDGDLQNDPADIPMMMNELQSSQVDMVVGRRANRQDGFILRKIPSRAANWMIRNLTGVHIRDYGCTLKVFKASVAKGLDLYGELHRFIPILAHIYGARIKEVDVRHHARQFGTSKYGLNRTLKVFSDMLLMLFIQRFRQKPMHLFGTVGTSFMMIGTFMEIYLLALKLAGQDIANRPLFYVGIFFLLTGLQLITTGFMADLIMRTYFRSKGEVPYRVASCERFDGEGKDAA